MRVLKTVSDYHFIVKNNQQMKGIIFDMDGTFFNTEPLHAVAHKKLVEALAGECPFDVDEILKRYKGLSDELVYKQMCQDDLISTDVALEYFITEKRKIVMQEVDALTLDDVFDSNLLTFVQAAKKDGVSVSLCTASERDITLALLRHFNFIELFDVIKTNDDVVESKPHPGPYLSVISELKLDVDEVVIFEDSAVGVQAAVASGAPMYKVEWYS